MEKIGQGLQFDIYAYGDKVIKRPTSKFQMCSKLLLWTPNLWVRPFKLKSELIKAIQRRKYSIENIQKVKINLELLGNPIFRKNEIEQDYVNVLGSYLNEDINKSKIWVDKFIDLIFECWKYGFSENIFNLTANNGVDKFGKVIFIDIGELTFEKNDVEKTIRIRGWENSWSFYSDLNKEIKAYYQEQMRTQLTLKNLNKYWSLNK